MEEFVQTDERQLKVVHWATVLSTLGNLALLSLTCWQLNQALISEDNEWILEAAVLAISTILLLLSSVKYINQPLLMRLCWFYLSVMLATLLSSNHNASWIKIVKFSVLAVVFGLEFMARLYWDYFEPVAATTETRHISLESTATFASKLLFHWLTPMINIGNRRPLEQEDLWAMVSGDRCSTVLAAYQASKTTTKSIYRRILKVVGGLVALQCFMGVVTAFLSFSGPFFLNRILLHVQSGTPTGAWIYLFGLFTCAVLKALNDGQMYFIGRRVGLRIRAILVGEIYEKSLKRALTAGGTKDDDVTVVGEEKEDTKDKKESSQGKIVTLMSVDTESIRTFVSYTHDDLVRLPISTVLAFVGLLFLLGWSAFAGLGTLLIMGPATTWLSKKANDLQTELMEATDNRVNITNEVLQGIRIIKYFAWEPQFMERILKTRQIELKKYVYMWLVWAGFGLLSYGGGVIVSFTTFGMYTVVQGNVLDPATAFTALSLLHRFSKELGFLPMEITHILQMKVSMERIIGYLKEPELDKYQENSSVSDIILPTSTSVTSAIGFQNATFTYHNENADTFTLRDLDVSFPFGKLSVIFGATGSGKSSIVLSLMGEMTRLSGTSHLPDPRIDALVEPDAHTGLVARGVAYVAQTAWILNATVRDNILFGRKFDVERYWAVIEACALTRDLETLDSGDMTEIGEKGVNLSGGQKQRISLARAAYSPATFILLDDPLSAVDAPTARHLLLKCILGPIMKGRTIVLVSHAVGLVLPRADYIVILKNGGIASKGTPIELAHGNHLQGIVSDEVFARGPDSFLAEMENSLLSDEQATVVDLSNSFEKEKKETLASEDDRKKSGKLVNDEEKATGSVRLEVYWSYLRAAGGFKFVFIFILSYILAFTADLLFAWWLKKWSDEGTRFSTPSNYTTSNTHMLFASDYDTSTSSAPLLSLLSIPVNHMTEYVNFNSTVPPVDADPIDVVFYIQWYAFFGVLVMVAQNFTMVVQLVAGIKAARLLHSQLLTKVLGAPMRFFEITPIGRILNRFSKDISGVDMSVMSALGMFIQCIFQIISILAIISTVTPIFLVFLIPIVGLYISVAKKYLNASRELKRLESISRSPIYAQFSETLSGVSTIRGYGQEERFLRQAETRVDCNHRAFFYLWASNRWLCVRTDIISACVVFLSGSAILYGQVNAGWAGLALSYSLEFTEALLWFVRSFAELEMNMNCVERIQEYSVIDQEPAAVIDECRPPADWPNNGQVTITNLVVKYSPELPSVLKNLTFKTNAKEKIGVVGRTGSGKSTLFISLMRIVEASEGSIVIDGIDISKIGLADLRQRFTIIPQDPVLFSGTLRSNLDPVEEHDDNAIWEALRSVHFLDSLQETKKEELEEEDTQSTINVPEHTPLLPPSLKKLASSTSAASGKKSLTLDAVVGESGGNFSQGQKQLLCLARALLRKSKFVLLDEATASIDNATDSRIQETIRSEFVDSTLFCIAHRLRTVVDYDKILVLTHGEISEYDSPFNLLMKGEGIFKSMCQESGDFSELVEIARRNQREKLN